MDKKLRKNLYNTLLMVKYVPKHKILYTLIIIMKAIPLFIITHDWNISSKKGISFYLRKVILSQFISSNSLYYFYIVIVIILFLILIYAFVNQINKYFHKLIPLNLKINANIDFYVFFALNQYFFSIFIEILFKKKKNELANWFYYFLLFIILILTYGMFHFNVILCSIVINEPIFFRSESILINELNEIDYKTPLLSFIQGIIQLEFYLKFKKMLIIKHIVRGLFCIFYFKEMFTFNKYYNRFYIEYFKKFFQTMCFISCFIEWIFYFDINNNLMILQKDAGIIFFKIIIEVNLSFVICFIYFHFDNKNLKKTILNFNSKNLKSFDLNLIKFFNMLYYKDRNSLLKDILMRLNRLLEKIIHNPKCKDTNCFYCYQYSFFLFNFQMNNFLKKQI